MILFISVSLDLGKDTQLSILELTDTLKKAMDKKLVTCGLFLDFSKAFDIVNHNILFSNSFTIMEYVELLLSGLKTI